MIFFLPILCLYNSFLTDDPARILCLAKQSLVKAPVRKMAVIISALLLSCYDAPYHNLPNDVTYNSI